MMASLRNSLLSALSLLAACSPVPATYQASNLSAKPFNQLDLAGNACGPAALLNSYRFGASDWRKLSEQPSGLTDRERIRSIARGPAMRESSSLPGRARWSVRGINIADLHDIANELARPFHLPALSHKTLFLNPGESQSALLRRVHARLATSLSNGLPPILSVRRFAGSAGKWRPIQGHYVTITSLPGELPPGATTFPVSYIDPLGGKFHSGEIRISPSPFLHDDPVRNPNLEAHFPALRIGLKALRGREKSYVAVSATLGRL